ncbi:nuclear transport factor 2 family protein [Streptomyces bobili]|uniref:nuclear transport factor 2 family protein n=1 Tax=Streptomyces bobili TaxID=67280 RepID=UPI00378A5891
MEANTAVFIEEAYEQLCDGLSTGNWQPFFASLGDTVDFIWPYPPGAGHYTGAEGRNKVIEFLGLIGGDGNRLTEIRLVSKTTGSDRIIFEDLSSGEFFNQPYTGRHCVVLAVGDVKITSFHEYAAPAS